MQIFHFDLPAECKNIGLYTELWLVVRGARPDYFLDVSVDVPNPDGGDSLRGLIATHPVADRPSPKEEYKFQVPLPPYRYWHQAADGRDRCRLSVFVKRRGPEFGEREELVIEDVGIAASEEEIHWSGE